MKCPICQADTEVKETRNKNGLVYRRRFCFNEHPFTTHEVAVIDRKVAQLISKGRTV